MPKYKVSVTCRESSVIVDAKDEQEARDIGRDYLDEEVEFYAEEITE